MFIRIIAFLAILLCGGFLYYMSQRPGGLSLPGGLPGSKPKGITEIVSKVPKDTGFLLVMDVRQGTDLKKDLQAMREKFKDTPKVIKAIEEAETEMGIKFDELASWALPAGFIGVLPAKGQTHLWGSAAQGIAEADGKGQLVACQSNLKNMATACEMYAADNAGRYPGELQMLTQGNYLKVIPTCPTQSAYKFEMAAQPDMFTLTCAGTHGENKSPVYSAEVGLIGGTTEIAAAPPKEEPPMAIFGAPVADEKLAQTHLEKLLSKSNTKPKQETVNGSSFWVQEGAYFGLHKGYLLGASSKDALEALLASFEGKADNLTAHPIYAEMRKRVPEEQGVVAFLPLEGITASLDALPKEGWDEKTWENFQAIRYLAGGASMTNSNLHSSLVLGFTPSEKADFVKALLTPPAGPMVTAQVIPADWSYYSAVDVRYLYHAIIEGVRLSPQSRAQVDQGLQQMQAGSGVDIEKDLFGAFTGELAWSGNYMKKMPDLLAGNFNKARSQGQLTACKSNLKNIATGLEMWASDNGGKYPTKLSQITPDYLKTIPTCPVAGKDSYSDSYVPAQQPDNFSVVCAGHNHGTPDDFPQYFAEQGLVEGETRESAPPADPGTPTTVLALAVKDAAKAEELLKKIDAMVPFTAGAKVGDAQILTATAGPAPVARVMVSKPVPVLFLAYGPDSETLLKECLEVKNPVSQTAEFQKVSKDQPQLWVSQSFIDLKGLLGTLTGLLETAPDSDEKHMGKMLMSNLTEARGVSYTVVEKDSLRLVSDGNAAIATGGTAVVAAILVPNFIRARSQGQLTACKSNEKNIATALEMYSTDNGGAYPTDLKPLITGNYLRHIPTCPAAGQDTYTQTYQMTAKPDVYSFYCTGEHHKGAGTPAGYPQYNAEQGLITNP
ncbi:DUF3352 domain-containing protein [bacterium]|nr:DUF3352 domain-containing protein [bacterium]